ncbi:MAG TPA: Nif3-like dinuclear metal center hexameric protein [Solirubrobacteraceae bacterium]|nr:Nif3-like dinuclear metal center hexameric protein [Solirubrobacteraceae bacterium]
MQARARVHEILVHLDGLLAPERFDDHGPNGLQVPGPETVDTVATGVSANLETIEAARDAGAQLVLVHHGLFWDGDPRALSPVTAGRLKALLAGDIALAAYHLPLDAHPEHGNNALIARGLDATGSEPFAGIGVAARFAEPLPAAELVARVAALTGREPLVFDAGPDPVRTIAIVSGAGAGLLEAAAAAGLDAFLTGEPREPVMGTAREAGIHFLAAGHYATETFGIRRLGDLVAERFGVRHVFVDVPNPV